MKKSISLLILFFILLFPQNAFCETTNAPHIDIPGSIEVENKEDITLFTLSELFGDSMKEIAGAPSQQNRTTFSELFIGVLGTLNIIAMIYVGASVFYIWVIFAVSTAHEGERMGGGVYDSLWVPIRQASAFMLTVPVLNGLSIMQIIIMACISVSINFANSIWNTAANYMVTHANVGIIESSAPVMNNSIYRLLPLMFIDSVVQQLDLAKLDTDDPFPSRNNKADKDVLSYPVDFSGSIDSFYHLPVQNDNGKLMFYYNKSTGEATIKIRNTKNMRESSWTGSITLNIPPAKEDSSGEKIFSYQLKEDIAGIQLSYILKLYGKVYDIATTYLNSRASSETGQSGCALPLKRGSNVCYNAEKSDKAIADLLSKLDKGIHDDLTVPMQNAIEKAVKGQDQETIEKMVSRTLDMENGKSKYGWASAGVFNLVLAGLQHEFDESVSSYITSTPLDSYLKNKDGSLTIPNYLRASRSLTDSNQKHAVQNAERYFNTIALRNRNYSASFLQNSFGEETSGVSDAMNSLKTWLARTFGGTEAGNEVGHSGILGAVLEGLGAYDPVVVMRNFGDRILEVATGPGGIGAGIAAATFKMTFVIIALLLLIMVGCFFAYIAPMIPFLFWMQALISWIFMVIEAMVAAPFWVCTHVLPDGQGFAGDHARRGYMLLLEVVCRPALLVVAAVFALALCQTCGWMLYILLARWFGNLAMNFLSINIFADLIYSILVLSLTYYVYFLVFTKGLNHIPQRVFAWCGHNMANMGLSGGEHTLRKVLVAGGALNAISAANTMSGVAATGGQFIRLGGKATRSAYQSGKEALAKPINNEKAEKTGFIEDPKKKNNGKGNVVNHSVIPQIAPSTEEGSANSEGIKNKASTTVQDRKQLDVNAVKGATQRSVSGSKAVGSEGSASLNGQKENGQFINTGGGEIAGNDNKAVLGGQARDGESIDIGLKTEKIAGAVSGAAAGAQARNKNVISSVSPIRGTVNTGGVQGNIANRDFSEAGLPDENSFFDNELSLNGEEDGRQEIQRSHAVSGTAQATNSIDINKTSKKVQSGSAGVKAAAVSTNIGKISSSSHTTDDAEFLDVENGQMEIFADDFREENYIENGPGAGHLVGDETDRGIENELRAGSVAGNDINEKVHIENGSSRGHFAGDGYNEQAYINDASGGEHFIDNDINAKIHIENKSDAGHFVGDGTNEYVYIENGEYSFRNDTHQNTIDRTADIGHQEKKLVDNGTVQGQIHNERKPHAVDYARSSRNASRNGK